MQGTRQRVFFLIKYFLCRMPPERALGKELFLKKIWHSTKNLFLKKFNFFVEGFRVWHLAKKIEKKIFNYLPSVFSRDTRQSNRYLENRRHGNFSLPRAFRRHSTMSLPGAR